MPNRETLWINVYQGPTIKNMKTAEVKKVFGCWLPKEVEENLFIRNDMVVIKGTKKVSVGWGENKTPIGYILGFRMNRKKKLQAFITVDEKYLEPLKRVDQLAKVDATKDVETKEITFHGLEVSIRLDRGGVRT